MGPELIAIIVIVSLGGWIANNWIRARHGYPLDDSWMGMGSCSKSGGTNQIETRETEQLRHENAQLRDRLEASEDRLAVLERIVTDRGYHLADEIEALREPRSARQKENG